MQIKLVVVGSQDVASDWTKIENSWKMSSASLLAFLLVGRFI